MQTIAAHEVSLTRTRTVVCNDDACPCTRGGGEMVVVLDDKIRGRFTLTDLREAIQAHQDQARAAAVKPVGRAC